MNASPVSAQTVCELTQSLHAFIRHLDERSHEALVALFLPHGRWLRQGRWRTGHDEIRTALLERPPQMRVRHVISNVLVGSAGDAQWRIDAYMTAYRQASPDAAPELFSLSLVSALFRRDGEQWRLLEQQMEREFQFPQSQTAA